jgi:hypothetical protein
MLEGLNSHNDIFTFQIPRLASILVEKLVGVRASSGKLAQCSVLQQIPLLYLAPPHMVYMR